MRHRPLTTLFSWSLMGLSLALGLAACGAADDLAGEPSSDATNDAASKKPPSGGTVAANPPPASCDQRHAGVTGAQVLVRISNYQGLITGYNGTHEIAYGNVISTPWVYDKSLLDTAHVQLALNVASAKDPTGLPKEVPLTVGQVVEVEGEWIPASSANAHDSGGAAAVLHFTHAPCGYLRINGTLYK